jgi:hypothetical protein
MLSVAVRMWQRRARARIRLLHTRELVLRVTANVEQIDPRKGCAYRLVAAYFARLWWATGRQRAPFQNPCRGARWGGVAKLTV